MITVWTSLHRNIGYGGPITAVLLIALAARAGAQPASGPGAIRVHVAVEADARCATPEALAAQVQARSRRIEFVTDPGDVPRLRIAIGAADGGERVVELDVQWPDGRRAARRLTAGSCPAAVEALGLLIAMTLDPAARAKAQPTPRAKDPTRSPGPEPAPEAGPDPEPGPEPGSEPDPAPDPGPNPSPDPDPSPDPSPSPSPSPDPSPSPSPDPSSESGSDSASGSDSVADPFGFEYVAVGISAQLVSGPAPRAMPGFGVYALLALDGAEPLVPAVGLQLLRAWASGLAEPGGDADFDLEIARLDGCPLGVRLGPLAGRACATFEIGRLRASGSNSYSPQSHAELWASLGGTLLLSVGLGALVELRGGVGLASPLRRYDFAFRPDVFHRVPGLCLMGHLGVGVRFP